MKRYGLPAETGALPSRSPGTIGGHRATRIYGRLDCPSALRAIANGGYVRHRVFFADEAIAVAAVTGRVPDACPSSTGSGELLGLWPTTQKDDVVPPRERLPVGTDGLSLDGLYTEAVEFVGIQVHSGDHLFGAGEFVDMTSFDGHGGASPWSTISSSPPGGTASAA